MLALTLKHPWPYAVAVGGKRIENRSWRPPAKVIGQWIGLHGGVDPQGRARDEAQLALNDLRRRGLLPPVPLERAIRPGIIGAFRLERCVELGKDDVQCLSPWFEGPFGWYFPDWILFDEPLRCCGAQGLWEIPPGVHAEMVKRWSEDAIKGGRPCPFQA